MRRLLLCLVLLIVAAIAGIGFASITYKKPGPLETSVTLVIPKGGSAAIAHQLKMAQVISSEDAFLLASHIDRGAPLKAGEYIFAPHISLQSVITLLRSGQVVIHHLTIPEGLTTFQIVQLMQTELALSGDIAQLPREGSLLPDTYNFVLDDTRGSILSRMQAADKSFLDEEWPKRDQTSPLKSKEEAIILASIVEKETGLAEERPKVAAVFLNRLKLGMKLQADPTVIYALGHGQGPLDRSLTHEDLMLTSPYNTYTTMGLPPGPICNPGRAAILAALHPDTGNELYFVATGGGGHAFAATLEDHNRNVAQWLIYLHSNPR